MFKNVGNEGMPENNENNYEANPNDINPILNSHITQQEVLKAVKNLKSHKGVPWNLSFDFVMKWQVRKFEPKMCPSMQSQKFYLWKWSQNFEIPIYMSNRVTFSFGKSGGVLRKGF